MLEVIQALRFVSFCVVVGVWGRAFKGEVGVMRLVKEWGYKQPMSTYAGRS